MKSEEEKAIDLIKTLGNNVIPSQLLKPGVGVEQLLPSKPAKIKSRQEALQSIFSGRRDIFYPSYFDPLVGKGSFSTRTGDFTQISISFDWVHL
jgi:hypothetical protein